MPTMRFRNLPAMVPGRLDCFTADPRLIVVDPDYNCRDMNAADTIAHVDWLADEIESQGYNPEQPLTVKRRGDEIVVIRGHCRLEALLKLIAKGVEVVGVPVMQIASGTSEIDLIFDQEASNNGLRLDQFAKARLCLKARKAKVKDEEIARRMHWKSINSVKEHIALLETPEALKQDVRDNIMSAGTALQLHREHGEAAPAIAAQAKAAAPTTGKKKGRVTPATVAKVTGKSSKQKQATDNLLNFVSVANKIEDEGKRAGGVERIDPAKLAAMARETVTALAKAKGQKVEDAPDDTTSETAQAKPESDSAPIIQPETQPLVQGGYTAPLGDKPTTLPTTGGGVMPAARSKLNGAKDLIEAIAPLAKVVPDLDPELPDDAVIFISDHGQEINAGQCRAAWKARNAATGGSTEAEAA